MGQNVIKVESLVSAGGWTLGAGASIADAIQPPDDDGTTYIKATTVTTVTFALAAQYFLSPGDVINFVRIVARFSKATGTTAQLQVGFDSTGGSQVGSVHSNTGGYETVSDDFDTSDGSTPWAIDDLAGLNIVANRTGASTAEARLTTLYVIIDYTPVKGVGAGLLGILASRQRDLALLVEIYPPTAEPGGHGFYPKDAELCLASIEGITFAGCDYQRRILSVGDIDRTLGPSFNSVSLSVDNTGRFIAGFILNSPLGTIEGYHLVVRVISRSQSTLVNDSIALFTGRCNKALNVDRAHCDLSGTSHLGSVDNDFLRWTFGTDDPDGRSQTDVLYEGFTFNPQNVVQTYTVRVTRGGLLGSLFHLKKNEQRTLAYTSYSDEDASTFVPEVFGRTQINPKVISGIDEGSRILAILAWCKGPIEGYANHRIITPGFSFQPVNDGTNPGERFGEAGGTSISGRPQTPYVGGPWPGDANYSHTAVTNEAFLGTLVDQQDPVPDRASTIIGRRIPVPTDGVFPDYSDSTLLQWSDNPAYLSRWLLTVSHGFNLPASFIDDDVCIDTANFCYHWLEDESNADRAFFPDTIESILGTQVIRYTSSGLATPEYFRRFFLADGTVDPWTVELVDPATGLYETFDPYDPSSVDLTPIKNLRRRFTLNTPITDQIKVIDVLYKLFFPSARLYLVPGFNSKIQIRAKRPVDNTIMRGSVSAGVTEIPVQSVLAWADDLTGKILIGHTLTTSENRPVTGFRYTTAGNSITLAVSGNLTRSGATLTGGDNTTTPSTGSVVVTNATGTHNVTIDGTTVGHPGLTADTINSVALALTAAINANEEINDHVMATWDSGTPNTVTITSKLGYLQFDRALEFDHDSEEQIIRIVDSFCDSGYNPTSDFDKESVASQSDVLKSNVLQNTITWPQGDSQSTYNQAIGTYRDASQDYKSTKLIVNDTAHQAQINKVVPLEINLAAVDNHHQASRILNGELAEKRDGDFFFALGLEGMALTLFEGDVISISEDSGKFVNVAIRIEQIKITSTLQVNIVGRRYLTSMFDDDVPVKNVPLPTTLISLLPPVPGNISIVSDGVQGTIRWDGKGNTIYQLATDTTGATDTLLFNGPGSQAVFVVGALTTVYLRAKRDANVSIWVAITIPSTGGDIDRPPPYGLTGSATDTTHAVFTWTRNATDNTDVSYAVDINGAGYGSFTDLGAPDTVTVTVVSTAGDRVTIKVKNKWSSGTTYSAESAPFSVDLPTTAPSGNDPTNLTVVSMIPNTLHGTCKVSFQWNPNSGSDPTLHVDTGSVTTYHPTQATNSHPVVMPSSTIFAAWVTNADGSNPSNTVEDESL